MGLFPKELDSAPQRMAMTRERGTRRLLLSFVALILAWYVYGQIHDRILLRQVWSALSPNPGGLTVVGTLDGRGSYDRNMFRIVTANQTSRAELTDYGWRTIFTGTDGELFTESVGDTIKGVIDVDGATGYAMLEPYLRVGIARIQKKDNPTSLLSRSTPITVPASRGDTSPTKTTLGDLLDRYSAEGHKQNGADKEAVEGGGGGGGHDVEHGLAIPADVLSQTCPVALTGAHFTKAELEEHPASMLQKKTYTVHLWLNDEGRSRFYQWSREHENESLAFVLKGQIAVAARVTQTLDVTDWQIGPMQDADGAKAILDFVNAQKK